MKKWEILYIVVVAHLETLGLTALHILVDVEQSGLCTQFQM